MNIVSVGVIFYNKIALHHVVNLVILVNLINLIQSIWEQSILETKMRAEEPLTAEIKR
jgi:hypothetical protein